MTLSSTDLSSQILLSRSPVVSAGILLLIYIFRGGDKKKPKNKSHSELTSVPWLWPHKCWESWGLVPAPISIRKCWFPPQQNLFHAGDSSQTLFITSFPPASIHTANSSCLCINSCFAFTELHPPSLSFFFQNISPICLIFSSGSACTEQPLQIHGAV